MSPTPQGGDGWLADFSGYTQEALEKEIARLSRVADRTARTMVVDDMQTMRLLLAQSLKQAGFSRVERIAEGETALRLMRELGCDLALVDWNMPRMDGLELLDRVRADHELDDIIFIMVTAETLDLKVMRAAEEKQDAYLTKPISAEKLTRRLELILELRMTTARALLLEARGEPDRAVEEYMAAAHNRPRARWPLFGLGGLLGRQGRMEEAERCYQRVLELDSEAASALVELGRIREAMGLRDEGRRLYSEAKEQNPRFFRAYDALAESILAEGDTAGALEVLEGAVDEQGTENAARQELLGRLRFEMGQHTQAEHAFVRSLELKPRHHALEKNLSLGRTVMAQGRWLDAVEPLKRAAELGRREGRGGEQLEAIMLTGTAYASARETGLAEETLASILEPETWADGVPPWDRQRYHRESGGIYLKAGRESPALRHFISSILLDPADQETLAAIRALCEEVGRGELAAQAVKDARAEAEQVAEECARRGLLLVSRGQLQAALAEYNRGLAIDPRSGRLKFNLGRLLERLEDRAGALAAMVEAARFGRARKDWELLVEVARFLAGRRHTQQARAILKDVLARRPEYLNALRLMDELCKDEEPPPEEEPGPKPGAEKG